MDAEDESLAGVTAVLEFFVVGDVADPGFDIDFLIGPVDGAIGHDEGFLGVVAGEFDIGI